MNTKPAFKILLLYAAGLVVAKHFSPPVFATYGLVCLASLGLLLIRPGTYSDYLKTTFLVLALAGIGAVRYELSSGHFPLHHISQFSGRSEPIAFTGVITRYPEVRAKRIHLVVEVESVNTGSTPVATEGKILLSVRDRKTDLQYGDRIRSKARIRKARDQRNPGEFDYRAYLQAQGIFGVVSLKSGAEIELLSTGGGNWFVREVVVPAKIYLDHFISSAFPPAEAALLRGLVIGERGEVAADVKEAFAKLGVIHILAVSGLHVGFIIIVVMAVTGLMRMPHPARVIFTVLFLIFYAYLTNLKPPVTRAATMGALVLLGTLFERKTDFLNSLAIAALVILIGNPMELFQAGFQLSFAAVAAIVYLYPKLKRLPGVNRLYSRFREQAVVHYALDLLMVSTAAFLGTLPFTVLYFNRIPAYSLIANLLVIPLVFFGLANGLVAALFHLLLPALASLYSEAAWLALHSVIQLVEWGSQLPFASWDVYTYSFLHFAGYFSLLFLLFYFDRKWLYRWLVIAALFVANVAVWKSNLADRDLMKITFIDVGQGDAVLLSFPDGRHALIDGGPWSPTFDSGARVVAPYLRRQGISEIDVLILSHGDSDHLGGLPYILRHFTVKEVWDNGQTKRTRLYQTYLHVIDSLGIEHRVLSAGDVITEFAPVSIVALHPTRRFVAGGNRSANDASLSFKFSYGQIDLLLLGDIEARGEERVNRFDALLQSEILKVSHHGSKTSSNPEFLQCVKPEIAVISVGEYNRFGHPAPVVLQRLNALGARILRTDRDSAVILETDGRTVSRVNWKH